MRMHFRLDHRRQMPCLLVAAVLIFSGCTSVGNIAKNRFRDAGDIVTFSGGKGAGLRARAGSLHAGAFLGHDVWGWRGALPFALGEEFDQNPEYAVAMASWEWTVGMVENFSDPLNRGKNHMASGGWPTDALIGKHGRTWAAGLPLLSGLDPVSYEPSALFHPYYTQIEAAGGAYYFLRLGVNPGEALDFVLGFLGIDMLADDVCGQELEADEIRTTEESPEADQP